MLPAFTSPGALRCILNKEVADKDSLLSDARKRAFASSIRYVEENIINNPDSITNVADLYLKFVEFYGILVILRLSLGHQILMWQF